MNATSDKPGRGEYAAALKAFLHDRGIAWMKPNAIGRGHRSMPLTVNPLSEPMACDLLLESANGTIWLSQVRGRRSEKGTECWAEQERLESLSQTESDWGPGHRGLLIFIHRHQLEPVEAADRFLYEEHWYAFWAVELADYLATMKRRSPRWGTVSLPTADFLNHRRPLSQWLMSDGS